jgi:hypothetical protein
LVSKTLLLLFMKLYTLLFYINNYIYLFRIWISINTFFRIKNYFLFGR